MRMNFKPLDESVVAVVRRPQLGFQHHVSL
jgi:hypothetical protein